MKYDYYFTIFTKIKFVFASHFHFQVFLKSEDGMELEASSQYELDLTKNSWKAQMESDSSLEVLNGLKMVIDFGSNHATSGITLRSNISKKSIDLLSILLETDFSRVK